MYVSVSFLCPVFYPSYDTFLTTCSFLIRISLLYSRHLDWWVSKFSQLLAKCFHFSHHLPVKLPGCDLFFFFFFLSILFIFVYFQLCCFHLFFFFFFFKSNRILLFFSSFACQTTLKFALFRVNLCWGLFKHFFHLCTFSFLLWSDLLLLV